MAKADTVQTPFVWVEQRFSLADLNPPFDAGGTGDAVVYLPAEKRLEITSMRTCSFFCSV